MTEEKDILVNEVIVPEAYAVGILWNDPNLYNYYQKEKLKNHHYGNKIYGFFLELGRYMNEKGINVFDDISTAKSIAELGYQKHYELYGGYSTIFEIMEETKNKESNLDGYVSEIKKYHLLRELRSLYGDKVIEKTDKYNYKKLTSTQIIKYWQNELHKLSVNMDSEIKEHNLLEGLGDLVTQLDEEPDLGMPYYNSKLYNDTVNGWSRGTVTLLSAFSGNGKTSYVVNKLIMACIQENEKLVIIGNEMSCKDYQKLLIITIIGGELYDKFEKKGFNRKNINKGNFTDDEKAKLHAAIDWIDDKVKNKQLIKFIPMEDYNMDNVESVVRYYANRSYFRWIVDTMKPSTGGEKQRWERFVEDSERLYQLSKNDGTGLNLAMHWNVQSADEALKFRFLDERCLADGKKIKNVVDVCEHFRPLWSDEYEGEKHELEVYKWIPDKFNGHGYCKSIVAKPDKEKKYYAKFISKNRKGMSNVTGLDALIYVVDFNSNRWIECGWAEIQRDNNY